MVSSSALQRIAVVETKLPHVEKEAESALKLASKAYREVQDLQTSLAGLTSEMSRMRGTLNLYGQIGSFLGIAMVLKLTSGNAAQVTALVVKALTLALRHVA